MASVISGGGEETKVTLVQRMEDSTYLQSLVDSRPRRLKAVPCYL